MLSPVRAGALLLLALGCSRAPPAQALAESFIDRYYIERDHPAALALAQGMAATRVASEKKLVEDARAVGVETSAVQPHIYYAFKKTAPKGADTELTYLLTIDSGGVPIKKELRVVVSSAAGGPKVSFFNETEL